MTVKPDQFQVPIRVGQSVPFFVTKKLLTAAGSRTAVDCYTLRAAGDGDVVGARESDAAQLDSGTRGAESVGV